MADNNDAALVEEYKLLQTIVEKFDDRFLQIKSWSVTVSIAAIGLAFVNKEPLLFGGAALSALLFWFLEGMWRSVQRCHYPRIREIEKSWPPAPNTTPMEPLLISESWGKEIRRQFRMLSAFKNMLRLQVFLPHLPIILAGLFLSSVYICNPLPCQQDRMAADPLVHFTFEPVCRALRHAGFSGWQATPDVRKRVEQSCPAPGGGGVRPSGSDTIR